MNLQNKTESYRRVSLSTKYPLPDKCPVCGNPLKPVYSYVGVFPYLHAGVNLQCSIDGLEYTFCFPFDPVCLTGYTVFDTKEAKRYVTERTCPFHPNEKLAPLRLLGDQVYNDGTKKVQFHCMKCHFSEKATFKKV